MPQKRLVIYSADTWEGAVSVLRLLSPLSAAGYQLIRGKEDETIFPERVNDADGVVIQRNFPMFQDSYRQIVELARAAGKPIIYETDDLLLELPEQHPLEDALADSLLPMMRAIAEADLVTVSTPFQANYYGLFNPSIVTLPNYLDENYWRFPPLEDPKEGEPITLGYMGGNTHLADLEMIVPALEQTLSEHENVRLHIWGGKPPEVLLQNSKVEWTRLQLEDYEAFAAYFSQQKADIWLAPLEDTRFNQAKSAIKFLEYSATGGAGVYSRLAPYEQIVSHEQNGLLAATLEEWHASIERLIIQPSFRMQLASAARQTALAHRLSLHGSEWQIADKSVFEKTSAPEGNRQRSLGTFYRITERIQKRQDYLRQSIATLQDTIYAVQEQIAARDAQIHQLEHDLEEQVADRDAHIYRLEHDLEEQIAARDAHLHQLEHDLEEQVAVRDSRLQDLNQQLQEQQILQANQAEQYHKLCHEQMAAYEADVQLVRQNLQDQIAIRDAQLEAITSSEEWKWAQKAKSIRNSVFSPRKK